VIADNCAQYANLIFNDSTNYNGSKLLLGALFFTFQNYGDFSGYSDIAIGTNCLFGFDLMKNFAFLISYVTWLNFGGDSTSLFLSGFKITFIIH
jgi:D-alanyl-lipoteichoic acid acyltransferase DltB (MBOAT superfamily)